MYVLGYRFYARYLGAKIFRLDPTKLTPAHELNDGVDYVPSRRSILFGHHYASIAGLAPMLGPAIAVIWGWLPAMLWVVLGTLFIGAVHDFGALAVSMRNRGLSIGKVAEDLIGPLVVVGAPGKSPGEVALHWSERRLLIVGDAVIGNPPGCCGLLREQVMDDPHRLRQSVRRLLDLDFDTLLVGDGQPILEGAKARLEELVATFPA